MATTLEPDVHPPYAYAGYRSTHLRAPAQPLVRVAPSPLEAAVPAFPKKFVAEAEADLTTWGKSAPLGEKMVLVGRVLDEAGRPVRRSLIEVWQANASGRYPHPVDDHDAPLDPNFLGKGQVLTDDEGRYRVVTIKPGAYPWKNHAFAWRPAHIHLSLFGNSYAQRLITQMFFPGDPLLTIDPIFNSVPDEGRQRLIADLDLEHGVEGVALGYRFDVVLRGSRATPMGA
ncbi:MAG: protocatechuate 3,4-dioxygenase subunit beta [Candidatus Rokuibacteriota bacterium]|nr:MAG: protocatechuate 3,4-dioxygenase subunit beta [Candidatus Rokubacteria bacterium]